MTTKLTREYTTCRDVVTAKRKVRRIGGSMYGSHTEPAQRRVWVEDSRVEVTIDVEELCRSLAARAIHTKSGKSTTFGGLIKTKVVKRVERDVEVKDLPLGPDYEVVS